MYRTKKEVDKHVTDILSKIKNENERNLRGFTIAKLYFLVQDYDCAKRYLAGFLSLKERDAAGHKLMAQIFQSTGHLDMAVQSYKKSLELQENQKDVVLKICELYCQLPVDPERARYWADRAEKLFPGHDVVFKLRECIVTADGEPNSQELEDLIAAELVCRPRDVSLRIKLLRLYLDTERTREAYDHAMQVESKHPYLNDINWYYCLIDVLESYLEEIGRQYTTEFFINLLNAYDRLVYLSLEERHRKEKNGFGNLPTPTCSIADSAASLHTFDQNLAKAWQLQEPHEGHWQVFLNHMRGQLYFHIGTLILKRAKKDQGHGNMKEAARFSAALFLKAYSFKPPDLTTTWYAQAPDTKKREYDHLYKQACFRTSQTGHVVIGMCKEDRFKWLQKIRLQVCTPQGVEKIYQRVYSSRELRQASASSHFTADQTFTEFTPEYPDIKTLQEYDEVAHMLYPDSLHHMVWFALQFYSSKQESQPEYNFQVFDGLQFNTNTVNSAAPESLCQLDVDSFLYATVRTTALALDERHSTSYASSDTPMFLPISISPFLCSHQQADWWSAAYCLFRNLAKTRLGELRRILQRGIEVVRLLPNHGMDVNLVVHIAKTFASKASEAREHIDNNLWQLLDNQAARYWKVALSMLDKLSNNKTIRLPQDRLFPSLLRDPSTEEVKTLLEEGNFYLACQAMNANKHEEALEAFEKLKSPYASYYQAVIYKKLAAEEYNKPRELITSEMRSKHIIMLTKARDALYATLDRLHGSRKHPLNQVLSDEVEDIETKLARIDPDTAQRHEFDGLSDECLSSQESEDQPESPRQQPSSHHLSRKSSTSLRHPPLHSTPHVNLPYASVPHESPEPHSRHREEHTRPSPERLDAQIRSLTFSHDAVIKTIVEQNKALVETNRSIVEELRQNKIVVEHLKLQLEDIQKQIVASRQQRRRHPSRRGYPPHRAVHHSHGPGSEAQDVEAEEDYYEGYYYEDDEYDEMDESAENAAYHDYHYGPQCKYPEPLQNDFPYGQVTGLHGTSTVTYAPPPGRPLPPPGAHPSTGYPAYYPAHPQAGMHAVGHHASPQTALVQGHPVHPQTLPSPQLGPGFFATSPAISARLPFSEGQKLPEFNFNPSVPPPSVTLTPIPPQTDKGSVFSRIGSMPNSEGMPTNGSQSGEAAGYSTSVSTTAAPKISLLPMKSFPVNLQYQPTDCNTLRSVHTLPSGLPQLHSTTSVPHAFQITLPLQALTMSNVITTDTTKTTCLSGSTTCPSIVTSAFVGNSAPSVKAPCTTGQFPIKQALQPSPQQKQRTISENEDGQFYKEEEEYSGPDFKPVIALPDEVELRTGEEDEKVLFEERAKLFRFVEKEWKERGVGVVKLLHHQATNRVRILMRRDQILKICANHYIRPEIKLVPLKNSEVAWTWAAQDYADEEMKLEQFCIRFKTSDIAQTFKREFEKAQTLLIVEGNMAFMDPTKKLETEIAPNMAAFSSQTMVATAGFGDQFKPKPGSWNCPACLVMNTADSVSCIACSSAKPVLQAEKITSQAGPPVASGFNLAAGEASTVGLSHPKMAFVFGTTNLTTSSPKSEELGFGTQFKPKTGSWECPTCLVFNHADKLSCVACETKKPGVPDKTVSPVASKFVFTSGSSGFNFKPPSGSWGCPSCLVNNSADKLVCVVCSTNRPGTTEDKTSPVASKFVFTTGSSGFNFANSKTSAESSAGQSFTFGFPQTAASSSTAVSSFSFGGRFAATSASSPVLSTVNTTSSVSSVLSFGPVLITTSAISTCTTATTSSSVIVTTAAVASPFSFTFAPANSTSPTVAKTFGLATTSAGSISSFSEQSFVFGSPKTNTPPKPTGYVFGASGLQPEIQERSNLSAADNEDKVSVSGPASSLLNAMATKYQESLKMPKSTVVSLTPSKLDSPKLVNTSPSTQTYGGFTFTDSPIIKSTTNIESTKSPRPVASKAKEKVSDSSKIDTSVPVKASPFAGFSFTSPTSDKTKDFSRQAAPTFTPKLEAPKSIFSTSVAGFSGEGSPSFSSLASTPADSSAFQKDPNFKGFSGSGAVLFKKMAQSPGNTAENDPSDDYEPSVDFKPVVPLPDLIEVKTGEEEETKLFGERAKLFRYDAATSQWKERGIGEMKILSHKQTGRCRILMRREQVLKLCANHCIQPGMQIKQLQTSDQAMTWFANDFAEGELKPESLAVKFKTAEIGKKFKTVFEQCVVEAKDLATGKVGTDTLPTEGIQVNTSIVPLSALFKPELGSWECSACCIRNKPGTIHCAACSSPQSFGNITSQEVSESVSPKPLSELFKPEVGSWECNTCYVQNKPEATLCLACSTPAATTALTSSSTPAKVMNINTTVPDRISTPLSELFKRKPGAWECETCYIVNDSLQICCLSCNASKPGSNTSSAQSDTTKPSAFSSLRPGFSFNFAQTTTPGSFSFGAHPTATVATSTTQSTTFTTSTFAVTSSSSSQVPPLMFGSTDTTEKEASGEPHTPPNGSPSAVEFRFGSPQTFKFNFSGVRPKSPTKTPKSPHTPGSTSGDVANDHSGVEEGDCSIESECDHIYFQPVIPLPDKVDVKTGEEDEEVLYCQRAKLFRLVDNEWKERGLGELKILLHHVSKKVRLLMRREQVLKICLNHYLTVDLKFLPKDDKSWLWVTTDFADNEPRQERFAIRFKSPEIANQFMNAIESAKKKLLPSNEDDRVMQPVDDVRKQLFKMADDKTDSVSSKTDSSVVSEADSSTVSKTDSSTVGKTDSTTVGKTDSTTVGKTDSTTVGKTDSTTVGKTDSTTVGKTDSTTVGKTDSTTVGKTDSTTVGKTGDKISDKVIVPSSSTVKDTNSSDNTSVLQTFSFKVDSSPNSSFSFGNKFGASFSPGTGTSLFGGSSKISVSPVSESTLKETGNSTKITKLKHEDDVTVIFMKEAPLDKIIQAKALLLPANFYTYEDLPPCPGCRGCEDDEDHVATKTNTTEAVKDVELVQEEKAAPEKVAQAVELGLPPNFYLYENKSPCPGCRGCENNISGINSGSVAALQGDSESKEPSKKLVLQSDAPEEVQFPQLGIDFASLAKQDVSFLKSSPSSSFSFSGSGAKVFGSATPTSPGTADDDVVPSQEVNFEPVVPLPDLIDVKTGEEEEEKVFCQRSKLYRFDGSKKEWKERGIGEVKILKHKQTRRYRLLFRREQVHKIACNHYLTNEMALKPLTSAETAWCWFAVDFAEEVQQLEQFAIRFKTTELAQEFKRKFEECQAELTQTVVPITDQLGSMTGTSHLEKRDSSEEKASAQADENRFLQPGVCSVGSQEAGEVDVLQETAEAEEAGNEDDDDEDEDEESVMFEKRVSLAQKDKQETDYKVVGLGNLRVLYDDDVYGARIQVYTDNNDLVCNHLIAMQTTLYMEGKNCFWGAIDFAQDPPTYRNFRATFSSVEGAKEFKTMFDEGKEYAQHSDIWERPQESSLPLGSLSGNGVGPQ